MNAKQVCARLGISRVTLHRRVVEGALTPLPKPPGQNKRYRLVFREADILEFERQRA